MATAPPASEKPRARTGWTPLIVALGVVLIAAAVGLIVAWVRGDGDDAAGPPPTPSSDAASAGSPTTTERPEDTSTQDTPTTGGAGGGSRSTAPQPRTETIEGIEVVGRGFSAAEGIAARVGSYGVVLENTAEAPAAFLTVDVAVRDATGAVVASDTHRVTVVHAGSRFGVGAQVTGPMPRDIQAIDVRVEAVGGPLPEGAVSATDVATSSDEFGTYTSFVASSTYDEELPEPRVHVVYRNARGAIVGGHNAPIDAIAPQGRIRSEVTSYDRIPRVNRAVVYIDPGLF